DHDGKYPQANDGAGNDVALWSENTWGIPRTRLWFIQLVPYYYSDSGEGLQCPSDQWEGVWNFDPDDLLIHEAATSYSLNYALRHFGNFKLEDLSEPSNLIYTVEVGSDTFVYWRSGGASIWDDGLNGSASNSNWLTARHNGGINITLLDGHYEALPTQDLLDKPMSTSYAGSRDRLSREGAEMHYNVSQYGVYWWLD
ncbi:MAG: hypothetical protein MI725_16325, partial [Pirellulales bacterium]|nr:hypothetical protein [Pirellulales bacterium]